MFPMRVLSDFIPDWSRTWITTIVTSYWAPRATGGHATWMQRRGGKQWRKKEKNEKRKIKLRVARLNVGTITRKGREVADPIERRGVQETRWKGEKARGISGEYITWYCGSGSKKNGVGITLKNQHVETVVELWRVTDSILCLKMELDGVMLDVIRAYAPQMGCIHKKRKHSGWN